MPRISKKSFISPNFSLYNNRGEYDNGADYFTGDLIYYAGDWWHCYDSAHLSPGYPPPSRPGNFVQITFRNKIISKTTEIKNIIAGIKSLNTQKNQIENFDPYFDKVSLLLPFDGDFQDYSKNNFSVTINGDAIISTTQSKYGGAAGYFDGVDGTYLDTDISSSFFDSDFTIEAWVWIANTSLSKTLFNPSPHNSFGISLNRDNTGYTSVFIGDGSNWVTSIQSNNTLSHSTWHHVAVSVSGNTTRLFHNGIVVASTNTKPSGSISSLRIGAITWSGGFNDENFNGYINDLRVTKGIARYTSNFTPPSKISIDPNQIQILNQIASKQNTLTAKVIKSEEKISFPAKAAVEARVLRSLPPIGSNERGYDVIHPSAMYSRQISFNNSPYYTLNGNNDYGDSMFFAFGAGVVSGYATDRFFIFKGQDAINFMEGNYQLTNTSDSRGYYKIIYDLNGNISNGIFRTNWNKYKRNNTWCLYDNLNDIMYYSNYNGDYVPTKKWYRADILYKSEIELKIRNNATSGSGSGSWSSNGVWIAIGINLIDNFLSSAGSGGDSIGISLIDQFLLGSEGSGSGGDSIGLYLIDTFLIDQFLQGPIFGPTSILGINGGMEPDSTRIEGPHSLYRNIGCGNCEMIYIDKDTKRFIYIMPGIEDGLPVYGYLIRKSSWKSIDYLNRNLPIEGWTRSNNNNDIINITPNSNDVSTWVPILGTANGWYNNAYWINNTKVETTLGPNGTGVWNNKYYIAGVETTLGPNGTGVWNEQLYINGTLASGGSGSGSDSGIGLELINQALKDLNFTGVIYGRRYVNGDLVVGWFENKYYLAGVETTLNSNGTGIWNNSLYQNGQVIPIPSIPNFSLTVEGNELLINNYFGPQGEEVDITIPGEIDGIKIDGLGYMALAWKKFKTINYNCWKVKNQAFHYASAENLILGPNVVYIEPNPFSYIKLKNFTLPNYVNISNNYMFIGSYAEIENLTLSSNHEAVFNTFWGTTTYFSGKVTFMNNVKYFISGAELPYRSNEDGSPFTGLFNGKYYIDGVETNLNINGSGPWMRKYYNNGIEAPIPTLTDYILEVIDLVERNYSNNTMTYKPYFIIKQYIGLSDENLELTLPSEINGFSIDGIKSYAFSGKTLKTIIIPNSFKRIWHAAFSSATIENMTFLPYDTGINFVSARIKNLILPENLSKINDWSLSGSSIENLTLHALFNFNQNGWSLASSRINNLIISNELPFSHRDDFNRYEINNGIFYNFTGGITHNGVFAYYIRGIRTTLPFGGTGIWDNKYYVSGIETTLPISGTGIWDNKYYVSGVETTLGPNGTGVWNSKYYVSGSLATGFYENKYYIAGVETTLNSNGTGIWDNKYYVSGVETTLPSTFENFGIAIDGSGIRITSWSGTETSVEIPSTIYGLPVRVIGQQAFRNNNYSGNTTTGLNSVSIPETVRIIEYMAFGYNNITSLTIPYGVTDIGSYAFVTNRLSSIIIPNSIVNIGHAAFSYQNGSAQISASIPQAFSSQLGNFGLGSANITYT